MDSKFLNNKWRLGKKSWSISLPDFIEAMEYSPEQGCITPGYVVLDPNIGSETVLFIVDYTPFAHEIAQLKPFKLNINPGLVFCSTGPILFLLFTLPQPLEHGHPFAVFEITLNPNDSEMMQPFWNLAKQSHWHVFVIGPNNEELNWFEFENIFNLEAILESFDRAASKHPCTDFDVAKSEFLQRYTVEDLLAMTDTPNVISF